MQYQRRIFQSGKTEPFSKIPKSVIDLKISQLTPVAVQVYLQLLKHANSDGKCWPGIPEIASLIDASHRSVQRGLRELSQAKMISIEARYRADGSQASNCFSILKIDPNHTPEHFLGCQECHRGGVTLLSPPGDTAVTPNELDSLNEGEESFIDLDSEKNSRARANSANPNLNNQPADNRSISERLPASLSDDNATGRLNGRPLENLPAGANWRDQDAAAFFAAEFNLRVRQGAVPKSDRGRLLVASVWIHAMRRGTSPRRYAETLFGRRDYRGVSCGDEDAARELLKMLDSGNSARSFWELASRLAGQTLRSSNP